MENPPKIMKLRIRRNFKFTLNWQKNEQKVIKMLIIFIININEFLINLILFWIFEIFEFFSHFNKYFAQFLLWGRNSKKIVCIVVWQEGTPVSNSNCNEQELNWSKNTENRNMWKTCGAIRLSAIYSL